MLKIKEISRAFKQKDIIYFDKQILPIWLYNNVYDFESSFFFLYRMVYISLVIFIFFDRIAHSSVSWAMTLQK